MSTNEMNENRREKIACPETARSRGGSLYCPSESLGLETRGAATRKWKTAEDITATISRVPPSGVGGGWKEQGPRKRPGDLPAGSICVRLHLLQSCHARGKCASARVSSLARVSVSFHRRHSPPLPSPPPGVQIARSKRLYSIIVRCARPR